MKRFALVVLGFILGVFFTLIAVQGSLRDLQLAFSPSLNFANGATYTGGLNSHGQLEGVGRMTWTNGDSYEGEFSQGLFHGKGTLTTSHSGSYSGDFVSGFMQGRGVYTYADGARYEGEFAQNQINGSGRWIFADKSIYTGQVAAGVMQGKGELQRSTGEKYTGDFVAGKMQGTGVFVDAEGNQYSGDFHDNNFAGAGTYTSTDGFTYVGEFKNWRLHGKGIQTDTEGNHWEGEYKNGQLKGNGKYIAKDGEQYTGEFSYGKYDGMGKLIASNGDSYEGEFSYGRKHGKGELIYKEPIDGISKIIGRWEYGRLVDGGDALKIFSAEEVTEYGLYKEAIELQRTLDSLQASNPEKIELYSLVVAGYGTEEVFHRESKFIEQLFTAQYDNRATAIYLANSQRSLHEHPWATRTSIRAAITRIAERMDKEQDIFFLYITSHGTQDKKIALNHNGLSLNAIDSKWLGNLLKETGIKHRVVVLSACFSGGFIDDLKDPYSLIMTAAAADKTSFGCADDSLFTYFGKAYFKEALKPGVDFEQAFFKAKKLVSKWEKEQKITESDPQIHPNALVVEQLGLWQNGRLALPATNLDP